MPTSLPAFEATAFASTSGPTRPARELRRPIEIQSGGLADWSDLHAAEWLATYNDAWLAGAWATLEGMLAAHAEFREAGNRRSVVGRPSIVSLYRRRRARRSIHEFVAADLRIRQYGGIGSVTFAWTLEWQDSAGTRHDMGRTTIGVRLFDSPWKAIWIEEARI